MISYKGTKANTEMCLLTVKSENQEPDLACVE